MTTIPSRRLSLLRRAIGAAVLSLALAGCAHRAGGARSAVSPAATCAHWQATAVRALATPPDSLAAAHHAHAVAMARYHDCLAGRGTPE